MPAIFKHFWIAFIVATFLNAAIWWVRSKPHRERDPKLASGYSSLIRGFVTWGNLPWLVMGAGIVFGGVPSIFHYFNPRSPNVFVSASFGSVFLLWVLGTHWIFARGGAEQLARHPGIIQPPFTDAAYIKALWLVCLAGGIAGFALMYSGWFAPPV